MEKTRTKEIIQKIISFSPRQLEGEKRTADFIMSFLKKRGISCKIQKFAVQIPIVERVSLKTDGKKINCDACCFASGEINGKTALLSSLIPSKICREVSNINFNPKCEGISKSNYYSASAICVSPNSLTEIIKAKKIKGEVKIKKTNHQSKNILVGNLKNPKNICFAHYDSIGKGAIDNASGVAVLLKTIVNYPKLLEENLCVFSGAEELSYDAPVYWGRGFRAFESKFYKIMQKCLNLLVIDCVGNGSTSMIEDPKVIGLAFPIKNARKFSKKIRIFSGDIDNLMEVYHSDLDDGRSLEEIFLNEAEDKLKKYFS